MAEAFICDYIRTPIGRFGGVLSSVRTDDLGAVPLKALADRNPSLDWEAVEDVIYGCANQAGEDNRNIARMASLLAGLPISVPGATVNRLCGSGMNAVMDAARAIKAGEGELMIAGGVESMSRAPFVMPKAIEAFSRNAEVYDTTIGWRFINPLMKKQYGVDSMPETGENVAADFSVSRADQDAFAVRSQIKAVAAQSSGRLGREIVAVTNDTHYGLSGAVIAGDLDEARRIGIRLQAGAVSLQDAAITEAILLDAEKMQFKQSGIGTSRMGPNALLRFFRRKVLLQNAAPPLSLFDISEQGSAKP